MPNRAKTIANLFLDLAEHERNWGGHAEPITPMSIQKLVYIAHGFYLANFGGPLLKEKIFAWKYGPVIPDLYHEFKRFGTDEIRTRALVEQETIPSDARSVVKAVWDHYKGFNAIQLSKMTHAPGTPWTKVRDEHSKDGEDIPFDEPIPDDVIRDYYRSLIDEAGA